MLVSALQTSIALHVRDTTNVEVSAAQLLTFINDAVQDASNSGWYIPLEVSAITVAAGDVAVPASLVFVKDILILATKQRVERHYWTIEESGGVPKFVFDPSVSPTGAARVNGWRRPTTYVLASETADAGMESFLRDRACSFALGFMAAGTSELDRTRIQSREIKYRDSEELLKRMPEQFKISPIARRVPTR